VAKLPTSARAIAARQAFRRWFTPEKIADIVRPVYCADPVAGNVEPTASSPSALGKTQAIVLMSRRADPVAALATRHPLSYPAMAHRALR
jgi:hypothetical protein